MASIAAFRRSPGSPVDAWLGSLLPALQDAMKFAGAFGRNFKIFDGGQEKGNALDAFAMPLEELPEAGYPIGALQVALDRLDYLSVHAATILGRSCRDLVPQTGRRPQHWASFAAIFLASFFATVSPL
jgi:hypothetical protein